MASLLDMNREEREEYVVQLYKENNSIREIARLVHMSFRDIGIIINKAKLQAERERGYVAEDAQPKSPESRAFKLFSEGKSPVEVAIALDEPGDRVRALYREYWELSGRYELAQIYDEARYDVRGLLRLHKIVKDLGLNEQDIHKVLELAKYDELQNLQWKVEYLRNEANMLETEKWKSTNQILKLNRMIDEFEGSLAKKRGETAYMNMESGWYDNTSNLYPVPYSEPDTSSYSIRLSYSDYWP
ncbi:MAG: hypothetical protein WA364_20140 [Candidatus Nitrosopolaris sp.]